MRTTYGNIPQRTLDALNAWGLRGEFNGGDFLRKVLENDLVGAFGTADKANKAALQDIVYYLWNHMPSGAWGNKGVISIYPSMRKNDHLKEEYYLEEIT